MAEYDQPALEKSKITWYSNTIIETSTIIRGLEEDKITWCSNAQNSSLEVMIGLEEDKITWCSTPSHKLGNMPKGLEEEITGVSNVCYTLHNGALRVWKRIELHGTQMRAWLVTYAGLEEDKIA